MDLLSIARIRRQPKRVGAGVAGTGIFVGFDEQLNGTLATGKLADLVVLSRDILLCQDDEILLTKVLRTIVREILYSSD